MTDGIIRKTTTKIEVPLFKPAPETIDTTEATQVNQQTFDDPIVGKDTFDDPIVGTQE